MIETIGEEKWLELRTWFDEYVQSFADAGGRDPGPIDLKKRHTLRVCGEITGIGRSIGLNREELRFAETIALLHDIGRFEQYAAFGTFADRKSVNHAELGVQVIRKTGILNGLSGAVVSAVETAVSCHNKADLPAELDGRDRTFALTLRDADKLDIWKVVTDYYSQRDGSRDTTIELDLPDTPGVSEAVVKDLTERRFVRSEHVRNLNDFKLLQIGWVFDIHFEYTVRRLKEKRYLELIRAVLPGDESVESAFRVVADHLETRSAGSA
ncbi:MAG: HD domain-containing protein [bacterium]|nr:HD domain-containing protein [bacterium]